MSNFTRVPGAMVALVTPFSETSPSRVSYDILEKLVAFHAQSKTDVIVPCGTTGEAPTLSHEEHAEVIRRSVEFAKGTGLRVFAGTGSNCTFEALQLTEAAAQAGADAALVVTPYYNRPSPKGVREYYRELDKVGLPIWLYNLPRRTGINLEPTTTCEIVSECSNVVGIKAANGLLVEISEVIQDCQRLRSDFQVVSGDDSLTLPILSIGGSGTISVIANVVPNLVADLVDAFQHQRNEEARKLHQLLLPLCRASVEVQSNPAAIKAIMRGLGFPVGRPRSPMSDVESDEAEVLMHLYRTVVENCEGCM